MYRKILLTGANGDIADALARILSEHYPDAELIGADAAGEWPGRAVVARMHRLPLASAPDYTTALRELAADESADLVIPTNEHELRRIADDRHEFGGLRLLCNPPDLLDRFLDKQATADWLQSIGLPTPCTLPLADATSEHLPLVVKPRFSSGSRRIGIVRTADHLAIVKREAEVEMIAQELLEPEEAEFTCAMVRPRGHLLGLSMRRRLLGGLSSEIIVEQHPDIDAMLARIDANLPAYTALNVQLRLTAAGPRIFEINPRFSSTAMMRHRIGFTDLAWVCDALIGRPVPSRFDPPVGTRVFRRFTEVVAR